MWFTLWRWWNMVDVTSHIFGLRPGNVSPQRGQCMRPVAQIDGAGGGKFHY